MKDYPDKIIVDIDGTLCPIKNDGECYSDLQPFQEMIQQIRAYRAEGFKIVLFTSRHMRTCKGNVGEIVARFSQDLTLWLKRHDIPYDELHFGKPWPGPHGFYVDDRTVSPKEFLKMKPGEVMK